MRRKQRVISKGGRQRDLENPYESPAALKRVAPRFLSVTVIASVLVLAGCLGQDAGDVKTSDHNAEAPLPILLGEVVDPSGDARVGSAAMVVGQAGKCGVAGGLAEAACRFAAGSAWDAAGRPTVGGTPAPPALDVTGLRLELVNGSLRIELQVASLGADFVGAAPPDGNRESIYGACWPDEDGLACAEFMVGYHNAVLSPVATFNRYTSACNDWWYCSWGIAHDVIPGTPGLIRLDVPFVLVGGSDIGPVVGFVSTQPGLRGHEPLDWLSWQVEGPLRLSGVWDPEHDAYRVDTTDALPAVPVPPPPEITPAVTTLEFTDVVGDARKGRADLDVQRVNVTASPEGIVVRTHLAEVEDTPADHTLGVALGLPDGRVLVAGFEATGGLREVSGGDGSLVDVSPGPAGSVSVLFPRSVVVTGDWDSAAPFTILYVETNGYARSIGTPDGPVEVTVSHDFDEDWSGMAPPFRLALD